MDKETKILLDTLYELRDYWKDKELEYFGSHCIPMSGYAEVNKLAKDGARERYGIHRERIDAIIEELCTNMIPK